MAYRASQKLGVLPAGKKAYLWLGSTDGSAKLFVNGKHVKYTAPADPQGDEKGDTLDAFSGYCQPARFDITAALKTGDNQFTILCDRRHLNELGTGDCRRLLPGRSRELHLRAATGIRTGALQKILQLIVQQTRWSKKLGHVRKLVTTPWNKRREPATAQFSSNSVHSRWQAKRLRASYQCFVTGALHMDAGQEFLWCPIRPTGKDNNDV